MTGFELDRAVKNQLRTLSKENAEGVGQHLVMAARLLDIDEDGALAHAETAVRRFFAALPSEDCAVLGPLLPHVVSQLRGGDHPQG